MIYIFAPVNSVTGGVELLHQLMYKLNNIGNISNMVYLPTNFKNSLFYKNYTTPNLYLKYGNQSTNKIEDTEKNCVVVPETLTWKLKEIKYAKKYIWWLSVDFYKVANEKKFVRHKLKGKAVDLLTPDITHLVQSYYAYEWLRNQGIQESNIKFLSDYLRSDFIEQSVNENKILKKQQIIYNPKKGLEFTKKIIEKCPYIAIPLEGFTPKEMVAKMQESMVYIDFGNHPGKDRIPREAAISGCCVITGKQGAAANDVDIPINHEFKFRDQENSINEILDCIDKIMNNYSLYRNHFDDYRKIIQSEESIFDKQVEKVFKINRNIG